MSFFLISVPRISHEIIFDRSNSPRKPVAQNHAPFSSEVWRPGGLEMTPIARKPRNTPHILSRFDIDKVRRGWGKCWADGIAIKFGSLTHNLHHQIATVRGYTKF